MSEKVWGIIFIVIAAAAFIAWTLALIALLQGAQNLFEPATIDLIIVKISTILPLIAFIWIPIYIAVLLFSIIFGWVGFALLRTPSIEEIDVEELEKEIEEEAKRIEEEARKKEGEQSEAT